MSINQINTKQRTVGPNQILIAACMVAAFSVQLSAQNIEVYETTQYGIKAMTPSIVIEESTSGEEFNVFTVNEYGLKHIHPDEIIENDN